MTRPEQQQRERHHVGIMIETMALELAGELMMKAPPLPDFALPLADGRIVGIEVTEARDPEVAAAWGGARGRLTKQIEAGLQRGSANAAVTVYLHVEALLELERDPRFLTDTAAKIVAVARASLPNGLPPTTASKLGIDAARFLEVRPANRPVAILPVSSPHLGAPLIQRAIDLKMPKLDGYRALGAAEYWLLVVGGETLSGYVTVADARAQPFESTFDRILFLEPTDRLCIEMAMIAPPSSSASDAGD